MANAVPFLFNERRYRNMAKGDKRTAYRDSGTGKFITERQAERKNPATWERQHIPKPGKGK
jgi:hypothetical protein